MTAYISQELRNHLEEVDNAHCAYCWTTQANTGQPMTIDHIIPEAQNGSSEFENLCFCCYRCNQFKGSQIQALDPLTGKIVPLYHPRQQIWHTHFKWDESGILIIGLTNVGRATVVALQLNNAVIVPARRRWVGVGWHPPI